MVMVRKRGEEGNFFLKRNGLNHLVNANPSHGGAIIVNQNTLHNDCQSPKRHCLIHPAQKESPDDIH